MAKQTSPKTRSSVPPKRRESTVPKPSEQLVKQVPSHEQIAARAFELYQRRAPGAGSALGDWLEAERELAG